jgi:hypothetical protein
MGYVLKQGSVFGVPIMKFTLTYDGELPAASKANTRTEEKWEIRKALDPQLRELWNDSEILQAVKRNRLIPTTVDYVRTETHHSLQNKVKEQFGGANMPKNTERLDLCKDIQVGNRSFLPLVRDSFALKCALSIKFLRKEEPGQLIYQGGDMDNRLKVLFDALGVPDLSQVNAVKEPAAASDPVYCLVENDRLITGLVIDTQKLLSRPGSSPSEVRLIIDVDIRVIQAKSYNQPFLGD